MGRSLSPLLLMQRLAALAAVVLEAVVLAAAPSSESVSPPAVPLTSARLPRAAACCSPAACRLLLSDGPRFTPCRPGSREWVARSSVTSEADAHGVIAWAASDEVLLDVPAGLPTPLTARVVVYDKDEADADDCIGALEVNAPPI